WKANPGREGCGALAFSHDGRRLASGDRTSILVWALPAPAKAKSSLTDERAWRDLADADAAVGLAAPRPFVSGPDAAGQSVAADLHLPPEADAKQITKLVGQLGDDDFEVRQKASEELAKIGPPARDQLREALKGRSLEARRRAAVLLAKLDKVAPERLRILR